MFDISINEKEVSVMDRKVNDISKKILMVWIAISLLCIVLLVISLYTDIGKTFFVIVTVANLAFFSFALLFRNHIER